MRFFTFSKTFLAAHAVKACKNKKNDCAHKVTDFVDYCPNGLCGLFEN